MSVQLRARAAMAELAIGMLAFNPHQRRDSKGRWAKMPDSELKRPRRAKQPKAGGAAKKSRLRDQLTSWLDLPNGYMPAEAMAELGQMFSVDDPATGFRTDLTMGHVQHYPDRPPEISVSLNIRDRDGNRVGQATRVLGVDPETGKRWVNHSNFSLNPEAQGGGFSSRWLAQMEDRYREAGIDRITIEAIRVGAYAWARAGFDFKNAGSAWSQASTVRGRLLQKGLMTPELDAQTNDMLKRADSDNADERPTPMEMAMLGWTPGATTWPGKEAMLDTYWEGVKEL